MYTCVCVCVTVCVCVLCVVLCNITCIHKERNTTEVRDNINRKGERRQEKYMYVQKNIGENINEENLSVCVCSCVVTLTVRVNVGGAETPQ